MSRTRRSLALPTMLAAAIGFSACGAESDPSTDDATEATPQVALETAATTPEVTTVEDEAAPAEEGADEDHSDEDHSDEDHDDEEHDDEDHDDEEHDDEDHDDHDHDDESGGLGAHEHGTAELSVAWIGSDVVVNLISPTFNVFGFEYEPTTDEDIAIEADRTAALTAPGVFAIDDAAGCTLAEPAAIEVEREGTHAEITVSWQFQCETPDAISQVDASGLFAEFPNFEDVDTQWISETEQSSAELSPSDPILSLQ